MMEPKRNLKGNLTLDLGRNLGRNLTLARMRKLARMAALACLCACAGAGVAQAQQPQVQVQDGIAVKPLSAWRHLESEQAVDQQAALQYSSLLSQARQQGALVPDQDPQVARLRAIARRLVPFTARWQWQVNLLKSDEVNAFCMPGGRIAFFSGIITSLRLTDDEVAAVMGHEVAHALREHGRERAAKSSVASLGARLAGAGLSAWLGIDPRVTGTVTNTVGQLVVLKFSRDEEREADLIGLDLAARAGFDPRAGVALWRKMGALNKRVPIALLSTHPGGDERIADIEKHMPLLLPLYARTKGSTPDKLPPYRGAAVAQN